MPIEIRELHIKVAVNGAPGQDGQQAAAPGGEAQQQTSQAIVAECVEQVLRILQNRMER